MTTPTSKAPPLVQNWISLAGIILAASSFFAVVCLLVIDLFREFSNPYMGVLTYLVAPGFLVSGIALIIIGAWRERRRRRRLAPGEVPEYLLLDLNDPHQRNRFVTASVATMVFLLITAIGSYRTYHYTESVQFCGRTCHTVMKPEFTAYQNSPHARVTCTQCHIGAGADWFVRSKLSGTYQVYATIANKYPRPIPTPVKNLRPAQDTCEQCHWPQKFFGAVEWARTYYLADDSNTAWSVRMLLKVGGGDPSRGPVGGIHWHMNVANKVEYIAADESRQTIPWVRLTDASGRVTVYQSTNPPPDGVIRRMDCIDCHNRPSHIFYAPAEAVDSAMALGKIDPKLPSVKKNAVAALTGDYATEPEALAKISERLGGPYGPAVVAAVQKIYRENFFPEMKVNWKVYPDNIGHKIWQGCFRCHDDQHVSADGKAITTDCNSCHTIIAQGPGTTLETVNTKGLEFQHPAAELGDIWKSMKCKECHNGALIE